MFCPQCRSELPDDAKFCVKCGYDFAKIKTPPEKKHLQDSLDASGTLIQKELEVENFQVGSLFANRYEILSEGLKGGMGVVYKCKDTKLNKIVALKIIHPRLLESEQALTRFRQEVSISQELQHANIVKVFNLEEWEGKEYFTMEWVEGRTLREIINQRKKENRPFSIEEAQKIISQLADALDHAHKYTIHRDIKPENILVTNDSELKVKLTDFGIAKMLTSTGLTSISMQMGTPYYMAPEQKTDAAHVDKRADIYALGIVLFELLTFENTIGFELPSEINNSLPKEIDNVIKRAVATKPDDRYGDAKEFSEALSRVSTIEAETLQREAEEQKRREEERKKQEEERKRKETEEQKKRQETEKTKLEAERIKAEEQKRLEEGQRRQFESIKPREKTEKKSLFNKVAIAAVSIVFIIIVGYIYNSKKEKPSEQSMVSQSPTLEQKTVSSTSTHSSATLPISKTTIKPTSQKNSRFILSDLTIIDNTTNLMWARDANLAKKALGRDDASEFIKQLNNNNFAGYNDWRLPTNNELKTLISSLTGIAMNGAIEGRMLSEIQENQKATQRCLSEIGFRNIKSDYWVAEGPFIIAQRYIETQKINWSININILPTDAHAGIGGVPRFSSVNFIWSVRSSQ